MTQLPNTEVRAYHSFTKELYGLTIHLMNHSIHWSEVILTRVSTDSTIYVHKSFREAELRFETPLYYITIEKVPGPWVLHSSLLWVSSTAGAFSS